MFILPTRTTHFHLFPYPKFPRSKSNRHAHLCLLIYQLLSSVGRATPLAPPCRRNSPPQMLLPTIVRRRACISSSTTESTTSQVCSSRPRPIYHVLRCSTTHVYSLMVSNDTPVADSNPRSYHQGFIEEHPGGEKILKRQVGKDASKSFWKVGTRCYSTQPLRAQYPPHG